MPCESQAQLCSDKTFSALQPASLAHSRLSFIAKGKCLQTVALGRSPVPAQFPHSGLH